MMIDEEVKNEKGTKKEAVASLWDG